MGYDQRSKSVAFPRSVSSPVRSIIDSLPVAVVENTCYNSSDVDI